MKLEPMKKWKWATLDNTGFCLWTAKPVFFGGEFTMTSGMSEKDFIQLVGFHHDIKMGECRRIKK